MIYPCSRCGFQCFDRATTKHPKKVLLKGILKYRYFGAGHFFIHGIYYMAFCWKSFWNTGILLLGNMHFVTTAVNSAGAITAQKYNSCEKSLMKFTLQQVHELVQAPQAPKLVKNRINSWLDPLCSINHLVYGIFSCKNNKNIIWFFLFCFFKP